MKSNRSFALQLAGLSLGMLMLAYASVPLYRLFCQVTGFGGTTQRVASTTQPVVRTNERAMVISFDANADPQLPWEFTPLERSVTVRVGENRLVAFRAKNLSARPTRGTATYNVTPHAVGKYFNKIQCFCFEEQRLAGNQSANLPVSFFLDPAMLDDPETRDVTNITLSYSFFSYESANKSKFGKSL